MDVSSIATVNEDEGVFAHFTDLADQPLFDGEGDTATPVGAVVLGSYSKECKAAQRKNRERVNKASRRGIVMTQDELDELDFAIEVACIASWTFTSGSKPFPITVENYRLLIERQPQWRLKVQQTMLAHERFFAKS